MREDWQRLAPAQTLRVCVQIVLCESCHLCTYPLEYIVIHNTILCGCDCAHSTQDVVVMGFTCSHLGGGNRPGKPLSLAG